ncbi:MAG TPA: AAA family ATPase, partial [Rhabdochlamydiaceae bacterium]|nr:AAA family ATPase [Rhabdochlamydiaceae bacterium]
VRLKAELHPSNQLIPLHEPLMRFTENWTNLARQGLFKPTVHQEAALQSVLQTLKCKTINNVLLIGRAGSGKTSLAQQTAIFMAGDSKNERLFLSLKLQDILEEARKSPRFITDLIDSLRRYAGSYVLFVDEFHNFFRIQTQDGIPLFELFKPVLAEGKVRLIGATTPEEAATYIFDKGEAVLRRFSHQFTPELTDQQSVDALTASKETYEAHFAQQYGSPFAIDPAAFPIAVQEAKTRVTHQALPASAITLFEEACSAKGAENSSEEVNISPNDIVRYAKARYPLHSWHSRIYQFFAKWFRYFFVRTNI